MKLSEEHYKPLKLFLMLGGMFGYGFTLSISFDMLFTRSWSVATLTSVGGFGLLLGAAVWVVLFLREIINKKRYKKMIKERRGGYFAWTGDESTNDL